MQSSQMTLELAPFKPVSMITENVIAAKMRVFIVPTQSWRAYETSPRMRAVSKS
jgi:hypothetical protein